MKKLRYAAMLLVLSAAMASCSSNSAGNGDSSSKTLGGSTDTMDAVAGSNAGGTNPASNADTSQDGNKNRGKDSTTNGNADPTGHVGKDTSKKVRGNYGIRPTGQ